MSDESTELDWPRDFERGIPHIEMAVRQSLKWHSVSMADVEDIQQEIIVSLWQRRNEIRFTNTKALFKYAYKAARTLGERLQNKKRKFAANSLLLESRPDPSEQPGSSGVKEEIEKLPERLRAVVELRLEGYTYQEISDKLGMAVGTAHELGTEAMWLLRKRLEE